MPSGGGSGGKKGGGGSVTAPTISTPPGLLQSLNSVQGIGQYGTGTFDTLASLGNWASGIATGGQGLGIGSFATQASQTGPTVTIGTGGPTGHDTWATSFNPQTGQITYTNAQTGSTFQQWYQDSVNQQYGIDPATLQQWGTDYTNRNAGAVSGSGGPVTASNWYNSLGPSLQTAWNQIQSIAPIETQTQALTNQATQQSTGLYQQGAKLFNQGQSYEAQAQGILNQGQDLLHQATTGSGLFPSQQAYVNQAVQAEQTQLGAQLAAEGLGSSTAAQVLKGQAAQQGAATAGQLVQGNIAAAQQQIALSQQQAALGQNQITAAQNAQNLAQGAQKIALQGQALSTGEAQAMAALAAGFQAQTWQESMQAYQTLGQMMSTTGALYGIDVTGYSNILQAEIAQGQMSLEAALGNAQASIGSMQSLGSGLGSLLGSGSGGSGGLSSLLSLGGAGSAGGSFIGTGGLTFASSAGAAGTIGAASAGGAGAAGGIGGLFSGLFGSLGGAASGIVSAIGGLLSFF